MKTKEIYDRYLISECGRLFLKTSNKEIKGCLNGRGYKITTITDGLKQRKTKAFHRIVAEAWVDNPKNLKEIDHIDGDKLNNCSSNLEWVSRGENIKRSYALGKRNAIGISNANVKHSTETIKKVCSLIQEGYSNVEIHKLLGVKKHLPKVIRNKEQWKNISKEYSW